MNNIVYKKRWRSFFPSCFIEIGLDFDNNKYALGISSEMEKGDEEIRVCGLPDVEYKVEEIYLRVWIFKYCMSIGTGEIEIKRKERNNFKIVIGLAAELI